MTEPPAESRESLDLHHSSHRRGLSLLISAAAARARDVVALALVTTGVTPNVLTVAGFLVSCCAGACLLVCAGNVLPWEADRALTPGSWWPIVAALLLTLAGVMDLLDGAVARIGRLKSSFGAILDSTLDRFSDLVIYASCAIHFALVGNITYVVLSIMALANAFFISYVKARAENLVEDCGVGFWQRGERCAVFVAAAYVGHIPVALWLTSLLPVFTVLRRLAHARALAINEQPSQPAGWMRNLTPWRHPRGSIGFDFCAAITLGFILVAPWVHPFFYGGADPVRTFLDALTTL